MSLALYNCSRLSENHTLKVSRISMCCLCLSESSILWSSFNPAFLNPEACLAKEDFLLKLGCMIFSQRFIEFNPDFSPSDKFSQSEPVFQVVGLEATDSADDLIA